MTYELKLERQYDVPPEEVFDTFTEKTSQGVLHGSEQHGWNVEVIQTDVRVGGTSIVRIGPPGREPDTETRTYSVVDRPHRLELRYSMALAETGLTLDTEMTVTFEEREGGTLFTMAETGFEEEAARDGFREGWTEYLETLAKVLKARHDT
jgi:uncharacterized protein YndB with AHSA1/START domain